MSSSSYFELERSLADAGSDIDAAEAHGCLCGALCAEADFSAAEWAAEILPDEASENSAALLLQLLDTIREETLAALVGDELRFQPLLPPEDEELDERVRALAAWCAGFLYGLGRSGARELPGDLPEIMNDYSEISRAGVATGDGGEQAERDYAELVEFVRASAQLAYEELAPQRRRARPADRQDN
jgi:uncharacterized protein YgfB (UPF0149 family)